ncbi:MAG: hypothetical protein JXR49_23600 [Acidobacteria bacterium]|nr:hypothetical protein [Acidobacteriota bacterium]
MAIFKDPINSLTFELPAGWANDLLYSTLTDFFFARWDRPEEMLVVHLRRACVAEDRSDDQWIEKIREEVGEKASLFDMDSPNGRVVAADFVSRQGMTQRVAFLRGAHVDIAVEQRNADMESPDPWKALSTAIKSAVSPANKPPTGDYGPVAFNKTIEKANKSFEKKDYAKVVAALEDAIKIGTFAWLVSLTSPGGSPEINAAVRVAQAMVHLGRFTAVPLHLRDAASILRRSLCSLEAAGKADAPEARELVKELKEILDSIQSELLEKKDPETSRDSAPIISIRERGFRSAQAAAVAFDAAEFKKASDFAAAAVEDFLFLLAYFRRGRSQQIPDEILKHLVDQGISDHEEQRDAIQKAREGLLFPALNLSLQVRYCCAMEKGEPEGASEAVELYLPLARRILDSSPGDTSIGLNLVLALFDGVGVIASRQDKEKLEEADRYLEEASQIVDSTGDKTCRDDGWVRNHKHQIERSLEALNKWLAAIRKGGDSSFESNLQSLHSKFETITERLRGKITPSEAVKSEEGKESGKYQE